LGRKKEWWIDPGTLARLCPDKEGITDVVLFKKQNSDFPGRENMWLETGTICIVIESGRTFTEVILSGMVGVVPTRHLEVIDAKEACEEEITPP
jgi:hypothetical protein